MAGEEERGGMCVWVGGGGGGGEGMPGMGAQVREEKGECARVYARLMTGSSRVTRAPKDKCMWGKHTHKSTHKHKHVTIPSPAPPPPPAHPDPYPCTHTDTDTQYHCTHRGAPSTDVEVKEEGRPHGVCPMVTDADKPPPARGPRPPDLGPGADRREEDRSGRPTMGGGDRSLSSSTGTGCVSR